METNPQDIVSFWQDAGPGKWFRKSDDFDRTIAATFGADVQRARRGQLDHWRDDAAPCLALIILLDQFPRNMFRGTAQMFASDTKAVATAHYAIDAGHDQAIDEALRAFVYMPFMHSEAPADQVTSVRLFELLGKPGNIKHALQHAEIIAKYSRFPHRNAILGRVSSPEELAFLERGGFSG